MKEVKRVTAAPREREKKQLSRPPVFRLYCRPARSALPPLAADTAMARARRRSRTPEGRTERRSRRGHHPGHRPGKVRADAPRDTRQAGYSPTQETTFELPPSGEYGVQGGECFLFKRKHSDGCGSRRPRPSTRKNRAFSAVRGQRHIRSRGGAAAPLTPCPAPGRRPTARAGQQPQAKEEEGRQKEKLFAGQQPQCTEGHPLNTPGHFNFEKGETRGGAQRRPLPLLPHSGPATGLPPPATSARISYVKDLCGACGRPQTVLTLPACGKAREHGGGKAARRIGAREQVLGKIPEKHTRIPFPPPLLLV